MHYGLPFILNLPTQRGGKEGVEGGWDGDGNGVLDEGVYVDVVS